jgi:autotransporter passenger strand-loop-strand repeat protein
MATTITAPPNRDGLVLDHGDVLVVEAHGFASNTIVSTGGRLDVVDGGVTDHTTVNSLGVERVDELASSNNTLIHRGGREIVDGGASNSPMIMGGKELVSHQGVVNDATIGDSGQLLLLRGGVANNVTFTNTGQNSVLLDNPTELKGTITNWHVNDYIQLADTRVVSVEEKGNTLTVTYDIGPVDKQVTYKIADQQPNTLFVLHQTIGGAEIVLVAGAQPSHHHDFLF